MKRVVYCLIAVLLISGLFLGCAPKEEAPSPAPTPAPAPAPAPAPKPEPIVLKAVTWTAPDNEISQFTIHFAKILEELSKGAIIIDYLGGPAAIPPGDQFEAIGAGIVDLSQNAGFLYDRFLPIAASLFLSDNPGWEDRERGYNDLLNEYHSKHNVLYLGRAGQPAPMRLYGNVLVENPATDFAGLKAWATPSHFPALESVGIAPVVFAIGDIYTALERGTIDYAVWSPRGVMDMGLHEVSKYMTPAAYGPSSNTVFIMNLDAWNKLSQPLKDVVIEAMDETERWGIDYITGITKAETVRLLDAGVEWLPWSVAEREWFYKTTTDAMWKGVKEGPLKDEPETYARLEKMLRNPAGSIFEPIWEPD